MHPSKIEKHFRLALANVEATHDPGSTHAAAAHARVFKRYQAQYMRVLAGAAATLDWYSGVNLDSRKVPAAVLREWDRASNTLGVAGLTREQAQTPNGVRNAAIDRLQAVASAFFAQR